MRIILKTWHGLFLRVFSVSTGTIADIISYTEKTRDRP